VTVVPRIGKEWPDKAAAWAPWWGRVLMQCPNGHRALLDHEVAADGTVASSVECWVEGCGWHVQAQLEGWPP